MTAPVSLDRHVQHFTSVFKTKIRLAGEAILSADWDTFKRLMDRVADAKITVHITSLVTSSADTLRTFIADLQAHMNPNVIEFVTGAVLAGVGGGVLAGAAGLALSLGVSTVFVYAVGVALILYGLTKVFPVVWSRITDSLSLPGGVTS